MKDTKVMQRLLQLKQNMRHTTNIIQNLNKSLSDMHDVNNAFFDEYWALMKKHKDDLTVDDLKQLQSPDDSIKNRIKLNAMIFNAQKSENN